MNPEQGGAFLPNGQPRKRPLTKKFKFTAEEDVKLKKLVDEYGKEWTKIASLLPGRTGRQCRDRWANYIDPSISTKPWSQDEDSRLLQKYAETGAHWRVIANCFPGRSINNVRNRCVKLLKMGQGQTSDSFFSSPPPSPLGSTTQKTTIPETNSRPTQESIVQASNLISLEDQTYDLDQFSSKLFDIFGEQQEEQLHSAFYDGVSIQMLFQ